MTARTQAEGVVGELHAPDCGDRSRAGEQMSATFVCGKVGCSVPVPGIYCSAHSLPSASDWRLTSRFAPGSKVRVLYAGRESEATVERVLRTGISAVVTLLDGREVVTRIPEENIR